MSCSTSLGASLFLMGSVNSAANVILGLRILAKRFIALILFEWLSQNKKSYYSRARLPSEDASCKNSVRYSHRERIFLRVGG